MTTYAAGVLVCLPVEFRDTPAGPLVDPPDARYDVLDPSGVVVVANEPAILVSSPGRYEGCYQTSATSEGGTWTFRFKATIDGNEVQVDCSFDLEAPSGVAFGPCQPWTLDETCMDLPEDVEEATLLRWQTVATDILWAASGRRYGPCPVTIRPCLRRCGGGSGVDWVPYKDADGAWLNYNACGCHDDCSCVALSEIVLPGPVASVVQVLIDGDELEEGNYRLDIVGGEYRLVRTDGGTWPECSDMTAACEDEGSFCVTFMQGIPLSGLAIAAVSEAAAELTKACIPGCKTCRLPKNTQAVVRRGVSVTMETGLEWIKNLPMVAAFLSAVNPNGLMSGSTVWSPDVKAPRVTPVS